MKKLIVLLLAAVMCLSLVACGGNTSGDNANNDADASMEVTTEASTEEISAESVDDKEIAETTASEEAKMSKDEMLSAAIPLTRDDLDKSISNIAFAKTLIGNIYTFGSEVYSVAEDHAVVTFYISDEEGAYVTGADMMVADLYLPLDELVSLENQQRLNFVGQLEDVSTHEESIPDWGTETVTEMVFKNTAIVSDRFESTGTLHSRNASYGEDAWNIEFPNSNYLDVVHFRDDVSAYQGKEITYSYKITGGGCVDAYIVE